MKKTKKQRFNFFGCECDSDNDTKVYIYGQRWPYFGDTTV